MANIVNKVKAKVEQALHKDETHSTTGGVGTHGQHAGQHGVHNDGLHSTGNSAFGAGTHNTSTTTTAGPHNSDLLNKADPRVDSDRSNQYGSTNTGIGGTHTGHTGTGIGGTHTGAGTGFGTHNTTTNTAGPHNSDMLNKMDPRVDSDRSNQYGSTNTGIGGTHTGHTGTGIGGTHTGAGTGFGTHNTNTNTAGPHNSDMLNKLDPRVDSDRSNQYGSTNTGIGGAHTGHTGTGIGGTHHNTGMAGSTGQGLTGSSHSTNAGPHNSNLMNAADPRVDSDRDGRSNFGAANHGAHSGTGPAPHTAGPHSSDMANKLDPRVDSNLDGSKTIGGNNTNTY